MLNWIKRWFSRSQPSIEIIPGPRLHVESGVILLDDPARLSTADGSESLRIEGVPPGEITTALELTTYPEGARVPSALMLRFTRDEADSRRKLGEIGVDTARMVAVDPLTWVRHWREVGDERIGQCSGAQAEEYAELIRKKFGLKWRQFDFFRVQFYDPIPQELEDEILEYLRTFPEHEKYPWMAFHVETANSFDQLSDLLLDRAVAVMSFDPQSGENLVGCRTGFGDGTYEVFGHYAGKTLAWVEVEFVTERQDPILKAFPS